LPAKGTTVGALLAQAAQLTTKSHQDLAAQNLAAYAADISRQQSLIAEANQLALSGSSPPTTTTTPTTTTRPKVRAGQTTTSVAHA
jgi:hypothetical protein